MDAYGAGYVAGTALGWLVLLGVPALLGAGVLAALAGRKRKRTATAPACCWGCTRERVDARCQLHYRESVWDAELIHGGLSRERAEELPTLDAESWWVDELGQTQRVRRMAALTERERWERAALEG